MANMSGKTSAPKGGEIYLKREGGLMYRHGFSPTVPFCLEALQVVEWRTRS